MTAPVGEVTTPITARHVGQRPLAGGVEQALGGELAAALLEQRHQRADAGGLHRLDDDLVLGLAGEGGDLAGGDHLQPLLRGRNRSRAQLPLQITASMQASASFRLK